MKKGVNFNELPLICQECNDLNCLSLYMNGTAYYTCSYPVCEHRNELYKIYEEENVDDIR